MYTAAAHYTTPTPHTTAHYIHDSKSFKKSTQFWKVRNVRLRGIKEERCENEKGRVELKRKIKDGEKTKTKEKKDVKMKKEEKILFEFILKIKTEYTRTCISIIPLAKDTTAA